MILSWGKRTEDPNISDGTEMRHGGWGGGTKGHSHEDRGRPTSLGLGLSPVISESEKRGWTDCPGHCIQGLPPP